MQVVAGAGWTSIGDGEPTGPGAPGGIRTANLLIRAADGFCAKVQDADTGLELGSVAELRTMVGPRQSRTCLFSLADQVNSPPIRNCR